MKNIFLVLILFSMGCSLLKTTETSTNKTSASASDQKNVKLNEEQIAQESFNSVKFTADSSEDFYRIFVWPKGKFSYSSEHGFEGEAEHLLITGRSKNVQKTKEDLSRTTQSKTNLAVNVQQDAKAQRTINQQNKRSFLEGKMLILTFLLFSIGVFVVWKWWKRS